ncbi:phosphatase PAP2 family protein [Micromonospora sp. NPDC049523]|uniref:phosphatase PAP2 family protein n=1 Tax=Micromonospora sp. NPDC049523 TaxID=3155921 RepID=UPI003429D4C2
MPVPLAEFGPAPARHLVDVAHPPTADGPAIEVRQPVPAPARRHLAFPYALGALRELLLVAALWAAYSLGRLIADGHVPTAMANAHRVWDLERALGLPDEASLQHLLTQSETLARTANGYYAYVHFPATVAFLVWLYLRRPGYYRRARNTLAVLTGVALVVHLVFPLAPPRMLAETGMIDTAARYGPSVYGSPTADDLTNQYAAMPSLHVGWALLVAVGLIAVTRSRWRWLWLVHPAVTLTVVVATANHYWLDGIVAAAILAAIPLLLPALRPTSATAGHRAGGRAAREHTAGLVRQRGATKSGLVERRGPTGRGTVGQRGTRTAKALARHRGRPGRNRTLRRIGVAVAGGAVILAGVAMLVLPGPGWLTIFAGLSLLGREFPWAKRLADRPRRGFVRVRDRIRGSRVWQRVRAR